MSAPHNSSPSKGPPNPSRDEQPNRASGTDTPPLPDQDLDDDIPSAAPQHDDLMPTETSESDLMALINSLASSVLYVDETGNWISAFVGRICQRFLYAHSSDKRDVLVSANTAVNVELAAFVLGMEGDVYGDVRTLLMTKFRQLIQLMLHAFRQWWYCWTTTPLHQLRAEDAARCLSAEAASQNPTGWMRALVSVFGYLPELWDLPSSHSSRDLGCPGIVATCSGSKGKGVDRSNMLVSDFHNDWAAKHRGQDLPTPMDTVQAAPTPDSGAAGAAQSQSQTVIALPSEDSPPVEMPNELRFIFWDGPTSSSTPRCVSRTSWVAPPPATTDDAPQATLGNPPQPPTIIPSQSTPNSQLSMATQGEGASAQQPSAASFPYGPGTSSSGAGTSGHTRSAVKIGAFDFTALARELGATQALRLPDATSTRAFEEATAHLQWAWGGSSHSLPLASGSSRGNRTAELREQARRLVQEYREVKEAQITKLAEAVQYLRSWHSLYLDVEYCLESRGIAVSPEFRAQATRMFVFINLLTFLVIHRRRQLERLG